MSSGSVLAYRIDFENTTNASAPTQQVIITDELGTNYDWSTFSVSEFGFGDRIIAFPPGIQHAETNVAVAYLGTDFQVQVQIGIQPNSGRVYASFRSIDPATSLPPPVNIGFLPPEDGTGTGQGHVTYMVRAKAGAPTGTQLRNVALISFDGQQSIATDQVNDFDPTAGTDPNKEAVITLDSVPPASHMVPLPPQCQLLQFSVSWAGEDDPGGSGIASFDIYVSDNGGPWTAWQSATTNTSAIFQGKPQHTYGFSSRAHDNAGNVEAQHPAADAATTVVANPQFELTVTPASTNLNTNDTFSYAVTVKNIGSLGLNNVVMSNAVPAGISLDWVEYGRGSSDIGDTFLLWSLGNMNMNVSASMNVTATAEANGTWTNIFVVADSDGAAFSSAAELIQIGATQAAPVLRAVLIHSQVLLSWAQSANTYHLETATNLVPQTAWAPVTNAPVPARGLNTVTLPVTGSQRFFRLHSQ